MSRCADKDRNISDFPDDHWPGDHGPDNTGPTTLARQHWPDNTTGSQVRVPTRHSRDLVKGGHAGMVDVNNFMVAHAQAPFGGFDHSGMGREGGRHAINDYLDTKMIHFSWKAA